MLGCYLVFGVSPTEEDTMAWSREEGQEAAATREGEDMVMLKLKWMPVLSIY